MNVKNRYYFRSRIREAKFKQLIRCFSLDFTATSTAQLTGISIRSVNTIYLKVRQRIAQNCELESPLQGSVEVDESYFGAQRVRGKRGRGAYGKTIVFGVLKRQGNDSPLDLASMTFFALVEEIAAIPDIAVQPLAILRKKLADHAFNLVVAGEFKRGKSTVINALLGVNLLPTGVVPLTSIVTFVRYGNPPSATVVFESGDTCTVPLDT